MYPMTTMSSGSRSHGNMGNHGNMAANSYHVTTVTGQPVLPMPVMTAANQQPGGPVAPPPGVVIDGGMLPPLPAPNMDMTAETVANMKEKTPMCLVNELARYNKVSHYSQVVLPVSCHVV